MLLAVEKPCSHAERLSGKCPSCGLCEHEVVLNAACYYCGETDLRLTIKPAADELVPLSSLTRRRRRDS
jgi:hypothetical protein